MAVHLLLLLAACVAPTPGGAGLAGRDGPVSVATLMAAAGDFEVGLLPGLVIILQGERVSLQAFRDFAVSDGLPLKNRRALIKARAEVPFSEVKEVIQTLKLGGCTDVQLKLGDPLPESAATASSMRSQQRPLHHRPVRQTA